MGIPDTGQLIRLIRPAASAGLPFAALAIVALLAIIIRSEAGPSLLGVATPVPDVVLKQPCIDGTAVGAGNDGLASDCALLLGGKDTLRGTETLNWSADTAIANWEGVMVGGSPRRVTRLVLDPNTSGPLCRRSADQELVDPQGAEHIRPAGLAQPGARRLGRRLVQPGRRPDTHGGESLFVTSGVKAGTPSANSSPKAVFTKPAAPRM